jgi:hypothetical protein
LHNKTLESRQACCAAFSEVTGSGKFNFLLEFLGLKAWPLSSPFGITGKGELLLIHLFLVKSATAKRK